MTLPGLRHDRSFAAMAQALIACTVPPDPAGTGRALRTWLQMSALAHEGWTPVVWHVDSAEFSAAGAVTRVRHAGVEVATSRPDGTFGLILAESWRLVGEWSDDLDRSTTSLIVDAHRLELLERTNATFSRRPADSSWPAALSLEDAKAISGELNVFVRADAVLVVSERDRQLVDLFADRDGVAVVVPRAVPENVPQPSLSERRGVIAVLPDGELAQQSALAAVVGVIAALRAESPLVRVVSSPTGADVSRARDIRPVLDNIDLVQIVGPVGDVVSEVAAARVLIVPRWTSGATDDAVALALACGTPVVIDGVGLDDLGPADGVIVADAPGAMAATIDRLLNDDDWWGSYSAAARATAADRFALDSSRKSLVEAVKTCHGR